MARKKSKMNWKDWIEQYTNLVPAEMRRPLKIKEPPCSICKYWNPERIDIGDGVEIQLCSGKPFSDFSCFEGK